MVDHQRAEDYFETSIYADDWSKSDYDKQIRTMKTAETMLVNSFTLRDGFETTDNFFNAVCEQAIHLLLFDKERLKLQREGVGQYAVGDHSFSMRNTIISPIAKGFLKPLIYKKAGNVVS